MKSIVKGIEMIAAAEDARKEAIPPTPFAPGWKKYINRLLCTVQNYCWRYLVTCNTFIHTEVIF